MGDRLSPYLELPPWDSGAGVGSFQYGEEMGSGDSVRFSDLECWSSSWSTGDVVGAGVRGVREAQRLASHLLVAFCGMLGKLGTRRESGCLFVHRESRW